MIRCDFKNDASNISVLFCFSCQIRTSPSITTAPNGRFEWPRLTKKYQGDLEAIVALNDMLFLLSIIETAKKQGLNILETIQVALNQSLVFDGARYTHPKMKPGAEAFPRL